MYHGNSHTNIHVLRDMILGGVRDFTKVQGICEVCLSKVKSLHASLLGEWERRAHLVVQLAHNMYILILCSWYCNVIRALFQHHFKFKGQRLQLKTLQVGLLMLLSLVLGHQQCQLVNQSFLPTHRANTC